jgi:hypothetical protein
MRMDPLKNSLKEFLGDGLRVSLILFRIMIPVIIVVKILKELGLIQYIASVLEPAMKLTGLPGSMGLVWATAIITNLYGGAAVFMSLIRDAPLSCAQITILTSMMLIAHNLPVEVRITREAGARVRVMLPLRLGSAFIFGLLLNGIFSTTGWLQTPGIPSWSARIGNESLYSWALGELKNLAMIFVIILMLVTLMKILQKTGITDKLGTILKPMLLMLGIGTSAATITVIGMLLGIAYGGGLIISEARAGNIRKTDVFLSLLLMGLCHALIEDTLLMMFLGGNLWGILVGRVIFSMIVISILSRLISILPNDVVNRIFIPGR